MRFVALLHFEIGESPEEKVKGSAMTTNITDKKSDRRRHGVIETRYRKVGKIAMYYLTIKRQLWACVGVTAVQLAKTMIRNGRMPTPEDAAQQLQERLRYDRLGELWEPLQDTAEAKPIPVDRSVSK
jgi:hypothetical protein